jgi:hypothetical protein
MSAIQLCLYVLVIAILCVVLYLLVQKVIPVTNKILPLVNLSIIPNIERIDPIVSDVTDTVLSKGHKPTSQVAKVVWDALYTDKDTKITPYTEVGRVMKDVSQIETSVSDIIEAIKTIFPPSGMSKSHKSILSGIEKL